MSEPVRQFVVLLHEQGDSRHWDLMLEGDEKLATWRLACKPDAVGHEGDEARRIFDHPKRFLDYEGPLSGDRGSVTRVDGGTYQTLAQSETQWRIRLKGWIMTGCYILTRADASTDEWTISHREGESGLPQQVAR